MRLIAFIPSAVSDLGRRFLNLVDSRPPWTDVYGLARTLMAGSTLITLLINPMHVLFRPVAGIPGEVGCLDFAGHVSLFCIVPSHEMWIARAVAIVILALAASGWRPRWTAVPHWWVSFSVWSSAHIGDGGDQVAAVLTLLMLPLALTDARTWHWKPVIVAQSGPHPLSRVIGFSSLGMMKLQVAIIYFHAAFGKLGVPEWVDGTAMYYWFRDGYMGLPGYLLPLANPLLFSPTVAFLTWSALVLELTLGACLFAPWSIRRIVLPIALLFHASIAWFLGITSFSIIMIGALLIYLTNSGDSLAQVFGRFRSTRADGRRTTPVTQPTPALRKQAAV